MKDNKQPFAFEDAEIPKVERKTRLYKNVIDSFYESGKEKAKIVWNGTQKIATVVMGIRGAIKEEPNCNVKLVTVDNVMYLKRTKKEKE